MVPIILYRQEKLLQGKSIESLMLRFFLGYNLSEFSPEQFTGEAAIACSGYLGVPADKASIDRLFSREPIKGIDYSNNVYRFIGIHLALPIPDFDEIDKKFNRFTIKNKFLTSCFFGRYENSLKELAKDGTDDFSKLLKILYFHDELFVEDEELISSKLLNNEYVDEIDIVLYHQLQKKFAKFRFNKLGSVELIKKIFYNFQDAIKHLTSRRKGHVPFEIEDEYDVQDLSYLVLRSVFDRLQFENPHLKVGGTNSKVDLMLVDEGIDIELKMIKQSDTDEKPFIKQIKIDINDYATWRELKDLIIFVYDPENKTTNRNNFSELSGVKTINGVTFNVHVIVSN